jgi:hypothetical protein
MMLALRNLGRNLAAGFRLALFMPATRLAFRIDFVQLLLLFAVSAAIDVFADWIRVGEDARFTWLGAGGELYTAGLLLLTAILQALLFGVRSLALAVPVLVFASYPVIQLAHAAPDVYPSLFAEGPVWLPTAFELVLAVWALAIFVRVVAVALGPEARRRVALAVAGGVMLMAGVALSPAMLASQGWWHPASATAEGRYPNPASEPVLAAQATLLDDALSNLDDQSPGETDLYFVGYASDARDATFREEVLAAQQVMDERWDTADRSLVLLNSPGTLLDMPMATVSNLRETLKEIAAAIDTREDVVMLYLAGPADSDGSLVGALPPLELVPLSPAVLRTLLDEAGIVWRIVVVSSCRADGFAEALQSDTTVVLAATDSRGCSSARDATRVGSAFFHDALPHSESLQRALEAAQAAAGGAGGTAATLHVGTQIARKLKELDRKRAMQGTNGTV